MDVLLGLMFWGALAFGVWWWVRNRKVRGISTVVNIVETAPTREPLNTLNGDIMRKLNQIHESIKSVEVQTKKVGKSVSNIQRLIWSFPIGFIIGLYWDNIIAVFKYLLPGLFLLIGLLFWGGIAYGLGYIVWYWVRNRRTLEIPPLANTGTIPPTPLPFNSDVMRNLNRIHESIEDVEVQTKKLEKSVKNISGWLWWAPTGFVIGLYWDNIVSSVFKSLFSVR